MLEKDWKVFRKKMPLWQERHMQKLVKEYAMILSTSDNPSTKFWELEKRIREDKKSPGVIADMRRSQMEYIIIQLLNEKVITMEDLEGFSEELIDEMQTILNMRKRNRL